MTEVLTSNRPLLADVSPERANAVPAPRTGRLGRLTGRLRRAWRAFRRSPYGWAASWAGHVLATLMIILLFGTIFAAWSVIVDRVLG